MDCVGGFSDWAACSAPCGGGTRGRAFVVTTFAAHGGAECPETMPPALSSGSDRWAMALQLHALWRTPTAAARPMENPYCGCELTRVTRCDLGRRQLLPVELRLGELDRVRGRRPRQDGIRAVRDPHDMDYPPTRWP